MPLGRLVAGFAVAGHKFIHLTVIHCSKKSRKLKRRDYPQNKHCYSDNSMDRWPRPRLCEQNRMKTMNNNPT